MAKRASLVAFLTAIVCFGLSSPAAMPSRYGHLHTCDQSRREAYYLPHPESCQLYLICDNSGNLFDGDCGENGTFDKSSLTCVSRAQIPCTRQEETDTDKVAATISTSPSTESTTRMSGSLVDVESSSAATTSSPAPLSLASSDEVTTAMVSDTVEETSEPNTRPNQTESLATSGEQKLINQSMTTVTESTEKIATTPMITPQTTSNIAKSSSPVPFSAAATLATSEATDTPTVLTHTHTHSTLPPAHRFQFFTTTTSGDIQKPAQTTTRSAALNDLKDATTTEESMTTVTEATEKIATTPMITPQTTSNIAKSSSPVPFSAAATLATSEATDTPTVLTHTHTHSTLPPAHRFQFFTTTTSGDIQKPAQTTTRSAALNDLKDATTTEESMTTVTEATEKITTTTPMINPQTTSNIAKSSSPVPLSAAATLATSEATETTKEATATPTVLTHTHTHSTLPPPHRFQFFTTTTSGDIQKPAQTTTRSAALNDLKDAAITEESMTIVTEATEKITTTTPMINPQTTSNIAKSSSPVPLSAAATLATSEATETTKEATATPTVLTHTHTHSTLPPPHRFQFFTTTTSGDIQKTARTTIRPAALDDLKDATITESSDVTQADAIATKQMVPSSVQSSTTEATTIVPRLETSTTQKVTTVSESLTSVESLKDTLSSLGSDYDMFFEDEEEEADFADYAALLGADYYSNSLWSDYSVASQDYGDFFTDEDEPQDKKSVDHCLFHSDGNYIPQSMIAEGCKEYVRCQDGETQVKQCPVGMTYDWKQSECVDPESNSVENCRPESLQQASPDHENLVDPSLSKECLHRKDGLYISQEMILEGCKNYISCKDENGRMETCSGEKTFDWKLEACVDPQKNTVPDCALVST